MVNKNTLGAKKWRGQEKQQQLKLKEWYESVAKINNAPEMKMGGQSEAV